VDTPLSALGSILAGGRYNRKGSFEVLYLAEDATTSLREVAFSASSGGRFQAEPNDPYVVFSVPFSLRHLVDLTDPANLARLGLTREELRTPWRLKAARGERVLTHDIGAGLRECGLEGFFYPSATDDSVNLAVLPENLRPGSYLEVIWDGRTLARLP
jgi:RES domain-containing protein